MLQKERLLACVSHAWSICEQSNFREKHNTKQFDKGVSFHECFKSSFGFSLKCQFFFISWICLLLLLSGTGLRRISFVDIDTEISVTGSLIRYFKARICEQGCCCHNVVVIVVVVVVVVLWLSSAS